MIGEKQTFQPREQMLSHVYSLLVSFFWLVGVVAQLTLTSCKGDRNRTNQVGGAFT